MLHDRENIRFNVLRNALYHTARRRVLERTNRVFNFLVVVLGASAVGDFFNIAGIERAWVGMAIAIIGALQLVFDFGRQARDHQALQRDYFSLLADIEAETAPGDQHCAEWYSRMIRITADEPPTLKALDAKAYNDALDAIDGHDEGERLFIPWWHRRVGAFVGFDGHRYRKFSEIEGKKTLAA